MTSTGSGAIASTSVVLKFAKLMSAMIAESAVELWLLPNVYCMGLAMGLNGRSCLAMNLLDIRFCVEPLSIIALAWNPLIRIVIESS